MNTVKDYRCFLLLAIDKKDKEMMDFMGENLGKQMEQGPERINIYKLLEHKNLIKELDWLVLLRKTDTIIIVTDIIIEETEFVKKTSKEYLYEQFKDYTDINYIIYFKQLEQGLVGYLIDCFEYYLDNPDKIKVIPDDNIGLYGMIKNQKIK